MEALPGTHTIELHAEQLLRMTQEYKYSLLRSKYGGFIQGDESMVPVRRCDINAMADTLKWNGFFVPTCVYNEAFKLAQEKGLVSNYD